MADDIGIEGLGCYGGTSYETPNLDRMARDGMMFTHAYAQPLCTPSRVKIMTGRYNNRNYEGFGYLNPKEVTFGNILKKFGIWKDYWPEVFTVARMQETWQQSA